MLDFVQNRNDVELTFDDANESDFTVALPALRARRLKARFFLVAERIGQPSFLSAAQLKNLLNSGMDIGSHGMRHRPWAGLDPRALREELVAARDQLEQLAGRKIDQASCPYGSYNRRVVYALRHAGYRCAYTSDGGPAQPETFLRPRNTVYNTWTLETVKQVLSDEVPPLRQVLRNLKGAVKRWR